MDTKKEILLINYWEHFKAAKELSLVYPVDYKRRVEIEKTLRELSERLNAETDINIQL